MEPPKGRRDFKMATLDVTEKVNVLVDAIGWEGFCEELMARMDEDALDAVCDRIAPRYGVHYPEEWEFGLITGATFFGKRGLVLQHGEDDVSSFTLNPSWLSCEDETQRCIMVEIYLEP